MTKRLLLLVCFLLPTSLRAAEPPQWLVVTAPAFRNALDPLIQQRKADGMQVVVIQTTEVLTPKEILAGDSEKLGEHVRKICSDAKGTSYILLVGAIEPGKLLDAETKVTPPLPGTISRMKGKPSDNGYGSPDAERMPAVAVGRFPARSEDEVKQMVAKTLAYEKDSLPGEWRQRITVLAGVPAFNPLVDKLVETMAMTRFDRLDPMWSGRAIYHNAQSRFCVPDDRLHAQALKYVQEGQALTLYLGHSWAGGLWAPNAPFLDRLDWATLKIPRGPGIFVTFGCNGCQQNGPEGEGYGIWAMRNPAGPVAVSGSHHICFAAMCQLGADGLLDSFGAGKKPERLADVWLGIKRGIGKGKIDDLSFKLLDTVDGDPKIPQATQRQEHLEMFLLLGDPALKLPRIAETIPLKVAGDLQPGKVVEVTGTTSDKLNGGKVRITLERPLTSEPLDLGPLPGIGAARATVMQANHERANRFVVLSQEAIVNDGQFNAKLQLPDKLPWSSLMLRAYATAERDEALGTAPLNVKKDTK